MTSTFMINTIPGSDNSIQWLQKMKDAKNDEIFMSNLELLVNFKWNQVWNFILADTFAHLFYYLLVSLEASPVGSEVWFRYLTLSYTFLLLLIE